MDEFVPVVEKLDDAKKDGSWSILDSGDTATAVFWQKQVGMWRYMVMNEDREPIDAGFFEDGTQIYTTGE